MIINVTLTFWPWSNIYFYLYDLDMWIKVIVDWGQSKVPMDCVYGINLVAVGQTNATKIAIFHLDIITERVNFGP